MAVSAEVKTRIEELERVRAKVNATLDQYPHGLTPEKQLEVDTLMGRGEELKTAIAQQRKMDETKADLANLSDFLDKPESKIPHGLNGDSDERKALLGAGWEIKNGIIHAPTSLGTLQPMYPEDVMFGEIPEHDPERALFYKTTRAAMGAEYKTAYRHLLEYTARTGDPSMAMQRLSPSEQKALSEGSDAAGGFLVPPDVQAEVLSRVAAMAVIRKRARVVTTNRDKVRFPAVAPNSTSGSIYSSGFVGGWVGETPAFSETDPSFQLFDIDIKKIRVATKLSNDFVNDAAINVLAWLSQNGAENMALVEDNGFISGNGGALQPLGILNAGLATVDVEGSTSNTISNTTSNTGSGPKIVNLAYAVPAQYVSGASWLMRRSVEAKVRQLTDASGRPLWMASTQSGFAATPRELAGYPIDNSDFMPADDADGNQVMIFGDFSNYIIAQRAQITSVILRERFADTDQIGLILFERVGGALWNSDAMRAGIV